MNFDDVKKELEEYKKEQVGSPYICERCEHKHKRRLSKCEKCGKKTVIPRSEHTRRIYDAAVEIFKQHNEPTSKFRELCDELEIVMPEDTITVLRSTNTARKDAEAVLKEKRLEKHIQEELNKRVVGEQRARHTVLLTIEHIHAEGAYSALIVNDDSSAGKGHVTKAVCDIYPKFRPGDTHPLKDHITRMTPQAAAYWHNPKFEQGFNWDGRFVICQEVTTTLLNSPAFRSYISDGVSTLSVRNQATIRISIPGRPTFIGTAANFSPNDEALNRFNICRVDTSEAQTREIINTLARRKETGQGTQYDQAVVDALGVLERVPIIIPFASNVGAAVPADMLRNRRAINSIFGYIEANAALHQFQREYDKKSRIIATKQDYESAKEAYNYLEQPKGDLPLTKPQERDYNALLAACDGGKLNQKSTPLTIKEVAEKIGHSTSYWYRLIDVFQNKGLIGVEYQREEGSTKQAARYFPIVKNGEKWQLPAWDDLKGGNKNDV